METIRRMTLAPTQERVLRTTTMIKWGSGVLTAKADDRVLSDSDKSQPNRGGDERLAISILKSAHEQIAMQREIANRGSSND
jgi:hypothetical protein